MHASYVSILRGPLGRILFGVVVVVGLFGACARSDSESESPTEEPVVEAERPDSMTVRELLRADPRFSTLAAGMDSTGLDTLLAGDGPYTLFAPPDTAFDALPRGTVPLLLDERRDRLRTILQHHIADGRIRAEHLLEAAVLPTFSGDSIRVWATDSTLGVGSTQVVERNIEGTNGIIHIIDRVLHPPSAPEE